MIKYYYYDHVFFSYSDLKTIDLTKQFFNCLNVNFYNNNYIMKISLNKNPNTVHVIALS